MSNQKQNTDTDHFFDKVEAPFAKKKEELWDQLSDQLDAVDVQKKAGRIIHLSWIKTVAASLLFIIGSALLVARFYTQNVVCGNGEHISYVLPDGSRVDLNAASTLSLHPFWWVVERKLFFAGEAFFDVEKGKNFKVESEQGITQVLGTSFNIFARENDYKVFCKTGKVRVSKQSTDVSLILHPNEMAVVNSAYPKGQIKQANTESVLAWKDNKFVFTSMRLDHVFAELERQYNVKIEIDKSQLASLMYTGFFSKTHSVETALNYVCISFNLSFEKENSTTYSVRKTNK